MDNEIVKKKPRGRPPTKVVDQHKKRNAVGRPKGDAAIMNDYKARMLASPKSRKVLESIFDAALDDEHKSQAAAWKLIVDRLLPVSMFEKEVGVNGSGGRPQIQINFGTIGSPEDLNIIEGDIDDSSNT